ncbi:MAG: hypothetical protein HDS43_07135 [Bacteroides sp.]|nr:hypothetical protein [Bacteroides sp.]
MKLLKSIFRTLFSEEISSLQKQIQSKQEALAEKETTISELRRGQRRLVAKIDTCHQEISNLKNQANTLRGTISAKDTELSAKNQRIIVLDRTLSEKKSESEHDKVLISDYRQQIDSLEVAKKELEQLIENQKQLIQENDTQTQQLENNLRLAKEQLENSISQKSALETKLQDLTQKIGEAQRIISETEKEVIEKNDSLLAKETELTELRKVEKSLEEEVNRLTGSLSESNSQMDILTSRNDLLEADKQKLQAKLNELKNQSFDEELLTALKNDVKQKQEYISGLEVDIQHLNEELSSIRNKNRESNNLLNEKIRECDDLKKELQSISAQYEAVQSTEKALAQAKARIGELENALKNAPTLSELIKRDKEIERLKSKIREYEIKIAELSKPTSDEPEQEPVQAEPSTQTGKSEPKTTTKARYRKFHFPYRKKTIAPSKDVVTVDFPIIENDNVYSQTARLIDKVFNHRSNSFITANDIFLHKSVEEMSRMRFELEEALRTGVPYLTCPCCGNMVKISSRSVGFGLKSKEVQFFTHAVKNIPCDLKRDNSYTVTIDDGDRDQNDFSYLKELRNLLANSLRTELSRSKGLSDVKDWVYINSDELPTMKRRLADVTARYNDIDVVFELVTPTTHVARVHDRDIFYLINRRQVFWILGLESIVDYNELRRSVSKDIFFTNKRNVFVFDLEAQKESKRRGELMLKCNWLDEDGAWYYQIEKNGKNGILISLDQIHFEQDSCRPYFYDADEPFYLKHPTAERPLKLSREKLKEEIIDAWNYEQQRNRAIEEMLRENRGVEAYSDGGKWGFKFGDTVFIEPVFDSKPMMLGDFAKVEKDSKFGVVNRFGEYRLQPDKDNVVLLPNGYILYASKENWYLFGVIDPLTSFASNDEVIVSTISRPSSIYHLTIGKYLFKGQQPEEFYFVGNEIFRKNNNSGKWSLWQSNGEKVTDVYWDSIEFTSEDNIKVSINGRTQILALDGTVLEEQKYKSETNLPNGYFIVETFDGLWGITDSEDIEVLSPKYDAIISLDGNCLKIQQGNRWGIITSTGEVIAAPIYHSVDSFDGECFVVSKPDETRGWGYLSGKLDKTGRPVSEVISNTQNGVLITKSFEKYGLEKEGKVIVPQMYDNISYWGEDKYIAQKDNKFGIIDSCNKVLLNFEYSSITPLKEGKSTIKRGALQNEIDSNLKIVEDLVIELQEGYKKIKLSGKWGILNPQGQVIVDYQYDEITTFRGRLVGILNERLIKLNAYYPYRLAMKAKNLGIVDSRDLVNSGGVKFQIKRRNNPTKGQEESVILINWMSSMKYPIVQLYDKDKHIRRAKHIDKPTDFAIGDTFEASVKSIIKGYGVSKGKIKGVEIVLSNGMKSYIFKNDFKTSGIDITAVNLGDSFSVTKLGYDEELDRTQWRVKSKH